MVNETARVKFLIKKWQDRVLKRADGDHSAQADFNGVRNLIPFDPTKSKMYLDWICKIYVNESFLVEDKERVLNTLSVFHRHKHHLAKEDRDINRFPTEQDLWDKIKAFTNDDENVYTTQSELKRQERAKALDESYVIGREKLDGWILATPHTHFASRWWSKGTRWCTGMSKDKLFDSYNRRGPLRIFIDPKGRKFQAHIASATVCDANDRRIDFGDFLSVIPANSIPLLEGDASQIQDLETLFMLPTKLITDDNFERMREEAKNKCNVLGENKVYSLVHLPSKLASWAYGLIDFNLIKKHAAVEDIVLLRQGELVASYNGDCNFFKKVSDVKDTEFVSSCVSAMVNLWIKRAYFLDDFINCLMASFDKDYFSQSVWERLISHAAKKRRAGLELKKHITSELITEEMADRLSSHNLDTLLPSDKITPERVNIFTRNRPEYIQFVRELGLLDMLDDDTLIKVSAWRNGKGYQLVPRERINRELLNRMIDARPNVILYLDEEHITDDLVDRATMNKPSTLLHLPRKFRNETRIMRTLSVYKDLYTHLKSEEKTKEINDYVLKTSPKSFIHVDMALTYEQVKNGVKDLPSALSRVPLIYRTVEVCQEALKSDPRAALPHVPPRVLDMLEEKGLYSKVHRKPLSKRYEENDPIHSYSPCDGVAMPEKMMLLKGKRKPAPIHTDPDGLLAKH